MKTLKFTGLGVLVLLIIMVIIGFFLPAKVHVERSMEMKAPKERIFKQINNLKNWKKWSPWHQIDPQMKIKYEGPEAGKGAKYYWKSDHKNVGNGSLTIIECVPYKLVETNMAFLENGKAKGTYHLENTQNKRVKVTWTMEANMGLNPLSRYFGLFLDGKVGPDFEKGLNNLKVLVEGFPEQKVENY